MQRQGHGVCHLRRLQRPVRPQDGQAAARARHHLIQAEAHGAAHPRGGHAACAQGRCMRAVPPLTARGEHGTALQGGAGRAHVRAQGHQPYP
eukprot:scaffold58101_cov36-Phaeocystis_antarctica.AAC.1